MYSVTPKLGRIGFEDNPTTAMVLYFFRSSRIASPPACVTACLKSFAPHGRSTLIARRVRPCPPGSRSPAPSPTSICHFLPPSRSKCGSLLKPPSPQAPARSPPAVADHRSSPPHPPPPQ